MRVEKTSGGGRPLHLDPEEAASPCSRDRLARSVRPDRRQVAELRIGADEGQIGRSSGAVALLRYDHLGLAHRRDGRASLFSDRSM